MSNRLAKEKSPYLLQHAQNPVDWHPWGAEAFALAKRENKPVFLSIGYSTCHWCHVMAHESFENPEIARLMNDSFINIKVDREERPDVDRVYMAFVQAISGSGGWPMSVWLTPDQKPFFGGTYFPPESRHGRIGFPALIQRVHEIWETRVDQIETQSERALAMLRESTIIQPSQNDSPLDSEPLLRGGENFDREFDNDHGGFGGAPKFPRPSVLNFLFRESLRGDKTAGKRSREIALQTLCKMSAGGIHDHLGGGFHRYSVDEYWHVPHFEKMLYDQAQLAVSYVEAWQITSDPFFRRNAEDILSYVLRDLTHPCGGFFLQKMPTAF